MTESTVFDYIVVGCGGIGSATLYWLTRLAPNASNKPRQFLFHEQFFAKKKKNIFIEILGLEKFDLGHHNGGSQDYSRIM